MTVAFIIPSEEFFRKHLAVAFQKLIINLMRYPNKWLPSRLGLYTQKIVKPVFKARGLMEGKILTHWSQIVGEKFADLALPEKITFPKGQRSGGTLHLTVTSSGSLLLHSVSDLIIERVNTFFGYNALSKLYMTHGLIPSQKLPPKVLPVLSQQDKEQIEGHTQHIPDRELKECLMNLGTALSLGALKKRP